MWDGRGDNTTEISEEGRRRTKEKTWVKYDGQLKTKGQSNNGKKTPEEQVQSKNVKNKGQTERNHQCLRS
jgi:hypothetical protein